MKIDTKPRLFYLAVFAVITCLLQAVFQTHSINIYHPSGFELPLIIISDKILSTEFRREICTILMLVTISLVFGESSIQKLGYLILSFVSWDMMHAVVSKSHLNMLIVPISLYLTPKEVSFRL